MKPCQHTDGHLCRYKCRPGYNQGVCLGEKPKSKYGCKHYKPIK